MGGAKQRMRPERYYQEPVTEIITKENKYQDGFAHREENPPPPPIEYDDTPIPPVLPAPGTYAKGPLPSGPNDWEKPSTSAERMEQRARAQELVRAQYERRLAEEAATGGSQLGRVAHVQDFARRAGRGPDGGVRAEEGVDGRGEAGDDVA